MPDAKRKRQIDAVDDVLEPLNLPNRMGRWRAGGGIVPGVILILVGIGLSVLIYNGHASGHLAKGHPLKAALIVLAVLGGGGLLLSVLPSWIAYRQLRKAAKAPPLTYTHFQTGAATSFQLPRNMTAAVIGYDETVGGWFGPVMNPGFSGSYTALAKEVDREAVNTLLFTESQIIGLMLGPEDLRNLEASGALKSVANEFLKVNSSSGYKKGVQFEALNANHWEEMVDALTALPLESALANHLNFGLPYDRIQSIEVKAHLVNPGITMHLKDGSHLRYATFSRSRLPEITTYLGQFVPITR